MNTNRVNPIVIGLIIVQATITAALGTHVGGFDLPPAATFALLVASPAVATALGLAEPRRSA